MNLQAWTNAERAAFDLLCSALGATESATAFLGYLPPLPGAFAFATGGSSTGGDASRLGGNGRAYACMNLDAQIQACHATRQAAQEWALRVWALFSDRGNFATGAPEPLRLFHLTGMPGMPELVEMENGVRLWVITLTAQVVFATA